MHCRLQPTAHIISTRNLNRLPSLRSLNSYSRFSVSLFLFPLSSSASDMVSPKELDTWLKGALAASGPPALEQSLQAAIATWGKSVFEQFDTDKNGFLDNKELGRALKALPKTKPTSAPPNAKYMSVEEMIAEMDADGSGGVDMQEWLSNLAKCAGLAAALAESVGDSGVIEKFRSFEQQKVRRCASVRGRAECDKTGSHVLLLGRRFSSFLRAISRCVFPVPLSLPFSFPSAGEARKRDCRAGGQARHRFARGDGEDLGGDGRVRAAGRQPEQEN